MICTACTNDDHRACRDEVAHQGWLEYIKSDLSEPTRDQHRLMKITRPYKSCDCQHRGVQ